MGFRPLDTEYKLVFADPKYDGLEVVCAALSVGEFTSMARLAKQATEDPELAAQLFDAFARSLISWNVENSHGPVPATLDGVQSQKLDFILEIITAWQQAHAAVPPPLPHGSGSPGPAREESTLGLARSSRSRRS